MKKNRRFYWSGGLLGGAGELHSVSGFGFVYGVLGFRPFLHKQAPSS